MNFGSYRPYMHIWLDLASSAARHLQPHLRVAGVIAEGYLAWVTARLDPKSPGTSSSEAVLLLVSIERMYLLKAIGRPDIAQSALSELR